MPPIALTHATIGDLIGAQRPNVTTALRRLAARREIVGEADRTWRLLGDPPDAHSVHHAVPPASRCR